MEYSGALSEEKGTVEESESKEQADEKPSAETKSHSDAEMNDKNMEDDENPFIIIKLKVKDTKYTNILAWYGLWMAPREGDVNPKNRIKNLFSSRS